jgi:hypothetical protein
MARFQLFTNEPFKFVIFCHVGKVCDVLFLAQVRADIRIRIPVIVVVVRKTATRRRTTAQHHTTLFFYPFTKYALYNP